MSNHKRDEGATMTDPKEQQSDRDQPDELELDAETVKDLDADAKDAEAVRGGARCAVSRGCLDVGTCLVS
jgi:hypothetical protein